MYFLRAKLFCLTMPLLSSHTSCTASGLCRDCATGVLRAATQGGWPSELLNGDCPRGFYRFLILPLSYKDATSREKSTQVSHNNEFA
jgi:hypothetical protein